MLPCFCKHPHLLELKGGIFYTDLLPLFHVPSLLCLHYKPLYINPSNWKLCGNWICKSEIKRLMLFRKVAVISKLFVFFSCLLSKPQLLSTAHHSQKTNSYMSRRKMQYNFKTPRYIWRREVYIIKHFVRSKFTIIFISIISSD